MQTETQEEQLVFSFLAKDTKEKQHTTEQTQDKKYIESEQFNFKFYNTINEINELDKQIEGIDY